MSFAQCWQKVIELQKTQLGGQSGLGSGTQHDSDVSLGVEPRDRVPTLSLLQNTNDLGFII